MKLLATISFIVLFSVSAFGQSYLNIFASVSYNSGTNQVTGYAYTEPDYYSYLYYNAQVNASIFNWSGTELDNDSGAGGGSIAETWLSATGSGCDYYQITASHYEIMYYYVQDYYWQGSYYTGYWDEYNYYSFNGDSEDGMGGPYQGNYTYFGPGPSYSIYSDHIIFGGTEDWTQGSCTNAPKIRSIDPDFGSPGLTHQIVIKGNGFDGTTAPELTASNANISFPSHTWNSLSPEKLVVDMAINVAATQQDIYLRVKNGSTPSTNNKKYEIRVPHHLILDTSENPMGGGYPGAGSCPGALKPWIRQLPLRVVDSNGEKVGPVQVKEIYASITTNTCNPPTPPTASACGFANAYYGPAGINPNGVFLDTVTVACNAVGGSCGYDITNEWYWCPTGATAVKIGTFTSTVHHNGITINGNTAGFSGGTVINP